MNRSPVTSLTFADHSELTANGFITWGSPVVLEGTPVSTLAPQQTPVMQIPVEAASFSTDDSVEPWLSLAKVRSYSFHHRVGW
jgi:hypothetical protein